MNNVGSTLYTGFIKNWDCRTIKVWAPELDEGDVEFAMTKWNEGLGGLGPSFGWAASSGEADLTISKAGGGTEWCGSTPNKNEVLVEANTPSTCNTSWSTSIGTVLVHEFAHVLGFQSILHEGAAVPTNCTIHLPDDHTITSAPCQHELEMVLAAYKYTTLDPAQVPAFWASRIVTGVQLSPTSLVIEQGQSGTVAVQSVRYARQLPPGTGTPSSASLELVENSSAFSATYDSPAIIVLGEVSGAAKLYARVKTATGARVGALAKHIGDSVTVTVTAGPPPPPPGSGFRVSSIDGPDLPITGAGFSWLEANVVNQPGYDLYVRWEISYSGGVHAPVNTGFVSGDRYRLVVPQGSYNISVTATPRSLSINGSPLSLDYPVCTDGDGGGGGNPNAVGGC